MKFNTPVPKYELENRLNAFKSELEKKDKSWQMVLINNPVNLYYLTGTVPDGLLVITKEQAILWVRRDYDRARNESEFENIRSMKSFREIAEYFKDIPKTVYLEYKYANLQWLSLIKKHLAFEEYKDVLPVLQSIRAIKSEYEIECMKASGKIQSQSLEQILPVFLREGVSEAELCGEVLLDLIRRGSMGSCRFENPHGEAVGGICSFSESGLNGISFDSPDGCKGTYIPIQALGSHSRKLKKGDIIFADIACGVAGYHTDKSVTYFYGRLSKHKNGDLIKTAYNICLEIEKKASAMLKPNTILSDIYDFAYNAVPNEFKSGFMFGKKFLGHSVGLAMDEYPAIAKGFDLEIKSNQVFALEPKIKLDGIGLVGTENTYLVSEQGGICLTGKPQPLIEII